MELLWIRLPLVAPFQTSFAIEFDRTALLVRIRTADGVSGWGECVAMTEPVFSSEYLDGAVDVLERFLIPAVLALPDLEPDSVAQAFATVKGHPMAKAALETAILDARLREDGRCLAEHLGGVRTVVEAGVSVGIMESIPELLDAVDGYLAAGYRRIKLKIQPGWDEKPVRAVRERFGDEVPLQVDANGAYRLADADQLARLDPFRLLMIEQPLAEDDLHGHAVLARRIATPICLDESVTSPAQALHAIDTGAAVIINIKPGRVGGYLAAKRMHDVCAKRGVPVWVGGMLETGIGRAANVALASLPNFTLVGDLSASDRFFARDITAPIVMRDGLIEVPHGPGIGVEPDEDSLRAATYARRWIKF